MSALVDQTLAELRSNDVATVRDALLRAAGFFEHAAVNPNPTSHAKIDALRDAVIDVVVAAPRSDPNLVALSLFVLGKHRDRSVVQFFVQWLVEHWREDPFATQQALIGLNNFDEPTLDLEGQLSSLNPDLTLRQAEHYLRSLNLI